MGHTSEKTYVIGHKNPDTDSICSAISYAYLKKKLTGEEVVPARAGDINAETAFVLKTFGMEVPQYLENVYTQVMDVEYRILPGVSKNISIKRSWEILGASGGATTLCAVDKNGYLLGIITIKDIAMSYLDVYDNRILAKARTPYKNILETLNATLVAGDENAFVEEGQVLIAAANPDLMENYIEENDIVILGNRYESQLCAIEMSAQCIIVCDGAIVSKTITKLAEEKGCSVISTPYDTFSVARLINQSIPISHFMKTEGIITFSTEDYTSDIRKVMAGKRYQYYPVLSQEGKYVGLISQRNYLNANPKKVILVDHNERSQAVDGIDEVNLLEIIDHHRIGGITTMNPVYFRNQPLGCTATIIYQMFCENNVEIPREIAGLLCSAIISDTLLFRSPTCTPIDESVCRELAKIARIDIDAYGVSMLNSGSKLKGKTDEDVFYQDYKEFTIEDYKVGIGQINAFNGAVLSALHERLYAYMKANFEDKNDLTLFMLTNILTETTELLYIGKDATEVLGRAFKHAEINGESVILTGVVSRKKQVVPKLVNAVRELES